MLLNDYNNRNDKDIFDSLFDLGKGLWNVGKKGYNTNSKISTNFI